MVAFTRLKLAALLVAALLFGITGGDVAAQALKITLAGDIHLGTWTGSGDKEGASNVCIYSDTGTDYAITATASGGSFNLSGTGGTIPFTVSFSDNGAVGPYTALTYGSTHSFSGANQVSQSCGGSFNGSVKVTVSEAALSAAKAGSYSRTLIVVLSLS